MHPLRDLHTHMSCPCTFNHGSRIMQILVNGITIRHLAFALEALIDKKEVQIHILTDEPEIGLAQSLQPGSKLSAHPMLRILARHLPRHTSEDTFVRGTWISRALGIEVAGRGAVIHLRSSLIELPDNTFRIGGAGQISDSLLYFDHIYDPELQVEKSKKWFGASFPDPSDVGNCQPRGDGTCEFWSKLPIVSNASLETSIWYGNDPSNAIPDDIDKGTQDAREYLQSPKYS